MNQPESSVVLVSDSDPTPRRPRPVALKSAEHVLREMRKTYNRCRSGEIPVEVGTKLVFMLTAILRAHEVVVMEAKLTAMETELEATANAGTP